MASATAKKTPSLDAALRTVAAAATDDLRTAVITRGLRALSRIAKTASNRQLAQAAAAPNDLQCMLEGLEMPEMLELLKEDDPLIKSRLKGLENSQRLLNAEGGQLTVEQVRRILRLSRMGVEDRRRKHRLVYVNTGRHGYGYPAWQFHQGSVLPGLERVLAVLAEKELSAWSILSFFMAKTLVLSGRTPLAALRSGQVDEVVRAASMYLEQGAA